MTKAVFPGSFDPMTNGHINIIQRAAKLFDEIDVVIAVNDDKKYLFSTEERLSLVQELIMPFRNVSVHVWDGLIVEYAKQTGAKVLIRGIRNMNDFSYEFDLSLMNHNLNPEVETLYIPTDQKFLLLKSSAIKELAKLGGDVSGMVPENVKKALERKYRQG
ncbi:MAG: pantetheine-phosphate adenylyltransferase [Treponema porcinum]|uniref:pantetheine-phosphate adenylyltransferase n=1 Tax=Treponema porcinum TaxID=261392 RepID=UPI002355F684|nr:pantetheine-phosphate adenylyltransferase [Treponema porcinum]MCI6179983.1 pantetheine-phosphate adenylyltransferase [Treponema porcinum]MCI6322717.1 pantetheine-phosphate adenylyltransferase [Treponema porcinum]MCI6722629.1 pantetheine-phosphate adenylyltransferase [Treponema porcinum]MCI6816698.1 pantetheine-phosphate adenylyltransferase [Treponema porcinum]MCI6983924.1 pantetheine-phosphate adenylyltransferase [Treponema porcinum]